MPQINRIRVNNVKYNFGTQVYDDFVMRFNCSNTIYDLANGGGKSLLMLLLMQNVIPNCALDDKQPIEKLFRQGGGNTVIHSLVEWKLDPCYRQDNYKYMTTGFCARKTLSQEEDAALEDVTAGSAGAKDSSKIEYFNYCIFYREFGDNDIKNLPLVNNRERITYNGLKAYLRDLEKKDFNVSVRIFDRKGDYQNFIARYGIYESQWEIVRGINKTEGHVRTYFETNYKTSRKVVEDLLIEEIIQKSFNNKLGVDDDEGKMAQTLMDIKDKLLELSKKHARISAYDSQISAVENFSRYVGTFLDIYKRKSELEQKLFELLLACRKDVTDREGHQQSLEAMLARQKEDYVSEQRAVQTAEVISEENSLGQVAELITMSENGLSSRENEIDKMCRRLRLMESANDYSDYLGYLKSYNEVRETVNNRMRKHEDIVTELKAIAVRVYESDKNAVADLENKVHTAKEAYEDCRKELEAEKQAYSGLVKKLAADDSLVEYTRQEIAAKEKELGLLMEQAGLIVAENALQQTEELKELISRNKKLLCEETERLEAAREKLVEAKAKLSGAEVLGGILENQLKAEGDAAAEYSADAARLDKLEKIYAVSGIRELKENVFTLYRRMESECRETEEEINRLTGFKDNLGKGEYTWDSPLRNRLKVYLESRYGEDVVDGYAWIKSLNPGQKRDVLKRAPFVEYGFVIKEGFERVREDVGLYNFGRGAYVIPVVSEQVLYDTRHEVNKELVTFAKRDLTFLDDEAAKDTEMALLSEELEQLWTKYDRQLDRKQIVLEDYNFLVTFASQTHNNTLDDEQQIRSRIMDNDAQKSELEKVCLKWSGAVKESLEKAGNINSELASDSQKLDILNMIAERSRVLDEKYDALKCAKETVALTTQEAELAKDNIAKATEKCESAAAVYETAEDTLRKLSEDWEQNYSFYYEAYKSQSENDRAEVDKVVRTLEECDRNRLESRFFGLKEIVDKDSIDVADKETLMNHYKISMGKCKASVEYRGSDWEEIKSGFEIGSLMVSEPARLKELKEDIARLTDALKDERSELEAKHALMNRLEGSIAHGINQIKDKYGAYEPFECDNPENFIKQHREHMKKISENIADTESRCAKTAKYLKDMYVIKKDLERIVTNAGLTVPSFDAGSDFDCDIDVDIMSYEEVSKEYDKHMKMCFRKKDEFNRHKQSLIDVLNGLDAQELAQEVRVSVRAPEDMAQTEALTVRLGETNTYIQLEKDRVSKGIEDMERIKYNFENRCIQTCCNIKTELDRLPKLSNITLDDESISIIGLSIPYVKEEMYKERMSSYIDETIMMAESFKDADERLKYIRNRLTWKRLFSVIVTDMNGIRIELYKRERIKDQSRYLRYEEAVGSTGQSQGIYIQFLIAIINYISSINATANDAALIGKTIFIDNPFGAAKDIYIWEPIFKLLKTNHVQLIVPARGATPAITGRFDVNYILGQKLVDNRQQTVVVDYYSRTNQAQMEYTRMEYEQASFVF